jgi:hypothetical protein
MDKAIKPKISFHNNFGSTKVSGSFFTCLLCGTFSACGGGLLVDWLGWTGRKSGDHLKMFRLGREGYNGTATLNKSFWLALLYYYLIIKREGPNLDLPEQGGHAIIGLVSIAIHLFQNTFSEKINKEQSESERDFASNDLFQHLTSLVLRLLNISYTVEIEGEEGGGAVVTKRVRTARNKSD